MHKLSRQQEIIVKALRSKDWVCGSVWLNGIKDDRARISALNKGYMKEKGWRIIGRPCDGRCGTKHSSTLYMRRAEPINSFKAILERPSHIYTTYLYGSELSQVIDKMNYYFHTI